MGTDIHPLALLFIITSGLLMLVLPRRAAIIPFIAAIVFIPLQQRVVIASLDFFILRILVLFGWFRVLSRSEYTGLRLNTMDRAVILYALSSVVVYTLLWKTGGAFVNRLGIAFDIIGTYFLVRFLVRGLEDIVWVSKTFAIICLPMALAMFYELASGRNIFSLFGGVPEFTLVRDGKIRAQGAFSHSITAGSFAASLFPMFMALRNVGMGGGAMWLGAAAAAAIVIATSSSGPAISFIAGLAAMFMWRYRQSMRTVRWTIALTLLSLHIVMKAPVWALIMKVKIFGASTAWHRYHLIDQWVNHFSQWWLLGTQSTASWGYYLFDVTNHYVRVSVDGGLMTLALFIAVLSYGFQSVGLAVRTERDNGTVARVAWALGAALFVHAISFFGVSYFDQIRALLYMHLAMLAGIRDAVLVKGPVSLPKTSVAVVAS